MKFIDKIRHKGKRQVAYRKLINVLDDNDEHMYYIDELHVKYANDVEYKYLLLKISRRRGYTLISDKSYAEWSK